MARRWGGRLGLAGALGLAGPVALVGALHAPWYRVAGADVDAVDAFRSADTVLGLLAVAAVVLAALPGARAAAGRLAVGLGATALVTWRIADPPPVPLPAGFVDPSSVKWGAALALAGALATAAGGALALRAPGAGLPLPAPWRASLRAAWSGAWTSRVLVWTVGVLAVARFSAGEGQTTPLMRPFGHLGNLLVSPGANWDAEHYLTIAHDGYVSLLETAFWPLYPLAIRAAGWAIDPPVVAGLAVAFAAFVVALTLLHRLTALELGERYAGPAVLVMAFFPMSLFLSAAYTESLFLALSVGCLYAGRTGRWGWASVLGGLAAATRNTGVFLLVPLLVLYLYGPSPLGRPRRPRARWLGPRYRIRPDVAWLVLVPAGLGAYLAYMATWSDGDPFTPYHALNTYWDRHFVPLGGLWDGLRFGFDGLRQLASGAGETFVTGPPGWSPDGWAGYLLIEAGFEVFAVVALVGVLRRLPFAYGAYVAVLLATTLSGPGRGDPLYSLPRYVLVFFPLQMWLAAWAVDRRRLTAVLVASSMLLALLTAEFATNRFVA